MTSVSRLTWTHGVRLLTFDGPYLQRFLINPDMHLAPDAALGAAVLARIPLPFVPFFERIEKEIALLQDQNDTVARARAIVNARNTTAAT